MWRAAALAVQAFALFCLALMLFGWLHHVNNQDIYPDE